MFSLHGKTSLITGAGSGIGAAIGRLFARAGAMVHVTDRNLDAAAAVAREIRDLGGQAEALELDVSSEPSCVHAAAGVAQRAPLNILVNNAGIGHVGTIRETSGDDLDRLYAVNLRGTFNATKAFINGMLERRSGVIINIASIGGVEAVRDRLAYCVTKFGVVGFTKCLALDHAKEGLRVNCICPGRVETAFVKARLQEYADPEKAYREMSATQAIGRMGTPEEIAAAALYLASDEAAFVTGAALMVDGGWSAGK